MGTTLATLTGMHVSPLSHFFGKVRRYAGAEGRQQEHPVVKERRVTATALTLFALALVILIGLRWGMTGLACYLPWLPFALLLLWGSTTALRFDERELPEYAAPERAAEAISDLHAGVHGHAG